VSVRFGVLLALGFGAAVAYLASLNTARVRVAVAADWPWEIPLAALVVGAFFVGAALAFALGRVYFELAMLDEAADQFQKVEVREPNLPGLHAFLGATFERRRQTAEAFKEYRRALTLSGAFDWPYRCSACGAEHGRWIDRCPSCCGWNTSRP
jgi:lipopolysaccharide biosynthesis regulator YciM